MEDYRKPLLEIGISAASSSTDSKEQLTEHLEQLSMTYPIAYGLTEGQMKTMGLYILEPHPKETDYLFAELGTFVINDNYTLQMADISNAPFLRSELDVLVGG